MTPRARNVSLAAAGVALFLAAEALLYFFVDRPVCNWVDVYQRAHPASNAFFQSVTDAGKSEWYLWPFGIAAIFCAFLVRGKDVPGRYRRLFGYLGIRAFLLFGAVALSGIAADILKPLFGRARPTMLLFHDDYGFHPLTNKAFWHGMPSGHSTTLFALAGTLSILYPRLRWFWLALAAFVSSSRLIVEAHYVSDVVAGAALGLLAGYALSRQGIIHILKIIFPIDSLAGRV